MKLVVTGATGFLGRYVVTEAVRQGYDVRAVVRPAAKTVPCDWHQHPQLELVRADLRASHDLAPMLHGVDTVVHLAAAKAGDLYEQFHGTVIATENLLRAMQQAEVSRIVAISSFAVYEYLRRWAWGWIDETSPLATNPAARDEYAQTKLIQEQLVREAARANGWRTAILRPGVIFGRDNLWTARLGMQLTDRWWLRTGTFAPLPLTYVENCADAIVRAAAWQGEDRELIANVVDDHTPTQRAYLKALARQMPARPRIVPIPWTVMRALARSASITNTLCFKGTAKVPGLLVPDRLHARCKPMRYTNDHIRQALNWTPRYTWQQGIERALSDDQLTALPASATPQRHAQPLAAARELS